MSKSLENFYTVQDILEKGYDPMALRYLYLQTHYRQEMNFTFDALDAAVKALERLQFEISTWVKPKGSAKQIDIEFENAVNDDLNMPKALGIMWDLVKSSHPQKEKAGTLLFMDQVLGLGLEKYIAKPIVAEQIVVPEDVQQMIDDRNKLRKTKHFSQADQMRNRIKKLGFDIVDSEEGSTIKKI